MPFKSKAQQKWAFANDKPWARRWAHETGEHHGSKASKRKYAALPSRVKRGKKKRPAQGRKR